MFFHHVKFLRDDLTEREREKMFITSQSSHFGSSIYDRNRGGKLFYYDGIYVILLCGFFVEDYTPSRFMKCKKQ